jgi:hypothetical protein
MKKLTAFFWLMFFICCAWLPNAFAQKATYLPSVLKNGRFYIKIPVAGGDTLLSFCDSGGGYNAIFQDAIKRANLESKILEVTISGEKVKYIPAKDVVNHPDIPLPRIQGYYQPYIKTPFFQTPADDRENTIFNTYVPMDAFLGQFFFIDHAWTFDYLSGKVFINTPLSAGEGNTQKIGFKKDRAGNKIFGHPSMRIAVDGEVIDVLFDTGASILLSKNTQAALQSTSKSIGGSFIEKGEATGADMIQVPQVTIGTTTAGPVWFAKRPDEAWSKGMIGSMDKVVKGAAGGSLFQYYVITIDYNNELVRFEKGK